MEYIKHDGQFHESNAESKNVLLSFKCPHKSQNKFIAFETVKLKNDDHKEESTVKKIKDAFEVLMENGDTHARKTPLKPRLKRCLRSKNTSGEKILMEKWLSK